MKTKPLWKISITTTPEAEDAVAEMLGAVLSRAAVSYHNLETGSEHGHGLLRSQTGGWRSQNNCRRTWANQKVAG